MTTKGDYGKERECDSPLQSSGREPLTRQASVLCGAQRRLRILDRGHELTVNRRKAALCRERQARGILGLAGFDSIGNFGQRTLFERALGLHHALQALPQPPAALPLGCEALRF